MCPSVWDERGTSAIDSNQIVGVFCVLTQGAFYLKYPGESFLLWSFRLFVEQTKRQLRKRNCLRRAELVWEICNFTSSDRVDTRTIVNNRIIWYCFFVYLYICVMFKFAIKAVLSKLQKQSASKGFTYIRYVMVQRLSFFFSFRWDLEHV